MDNNKKLFEELLKADGINPAGASESERIAFAKILDQQLNPKQSHPASRPNVWRVFMKSRITKFTAAAVLIIAAVLTITILNNTATPAYALQDTIEAYNSIRWLHINESTTISQETRTSEIWLGCDEQGNVNKMRFQLDNAGESIGPLTIAGDSNKSEVWIPMHNLRMVGCGSPGILLNYDVSELDPKFFFQRLFEQESRNEAVVDVNKPMEKSNPIIVTVTYPMGSRSENWKKVFYIDQATKLITRIDKFERKNQEFQHIKTLELSDYNQQIDQRMFTLDSETPANAQVIDMSKVEVGLPQGDMTNEEIAAEVTKQYAEAIIAKDFYKVGQLFLGAPDCLTKKLASGNALKVISVGLAHPDSDPDSHAMISSCKVLAESGGQSFEVNIWMVKVVKTDKDTNRWVISGTMQSVSPVPAP